jgi:hypothetical protein
MRSPARQATRPGLRRPHHCCRSDCAARFHHRFRTKISESPSLPVKAIVRLSGDHTISPGDEGTSNRLPLPSAFITHRWSSVMKAIQRPSGDHSTPQARSAPSGFASTRRPLPSRFMTYTAPLSTWVKVIRRPSRDQAGPPEPPAGGDSTFATSARAHHPDRIRPVVVLLGGDALPVGRPYWQHAVHPVAGQPAKTAAVGVDDVEIPIRVTVLRVERDPASVG